MISPVTLEPLEQQITQLSLQDQLQLAAYIADRVRAALPPALNPVAEETLRGQREAEAERLLALCDAAAALWLGNFDAVEDLRQIRQTRDEQLWPSK